MRSSATLRLPMQLLCILFTTLMHGETRSGRGIAVTRLTDLTMNEKSPQYVAVHDKFHDLCSVISGAPDSIVPLGQKLYAKGIIGQTANSNLVVAVGAGRAPAEIVSQLMQAVHIKIKFVPKSFYVFVDALNECQLPTNIGEDLEARCREFVLVKSCITMSYQEPMGSWSYLILGYELCNIELVANA